jgi:SAM-dependent methyltransferase
MANCREQFYEAYWSDPAKAIPIDDPTTMERQRLLEQALKDFLGQRSHRSQGIVLDAGCGSGEFTRFLSKLGYDTVGIDIAAAAVERARIGWPEGRFYVGSLEQALPFQDEEYDAIWNTEVLEHLFDVHACLSEFNRVLREDGLLILTVPFHGLVKNLAVSIAGFERHYNPYVSHIRFFTKRSLTNALCHAGFDPFQWRGIGRIWPFYKSIFVVARKVRPSRPAPEITG